MRPRGSVAITSSLLEMVVVEMADTAVASGLGEADRDTDLEPGLEAGDRERDLLRGEAVRLATLAFFLSCLNKLSTFLFLVLGLLSFLIRDISFCSSRVFFWNSVTLSS